MTTPGQETAFTNKGGGEFPSQAALLGGVVLRRPGPWTPAVLALLRHLEQVGFDAAPRVVGSGVADDGREMLSFIPGASLQPRPWSDDAVAEVGAILRRLHEAAGDFRPPPGAVWRPSTLRSLPGRDRVIGHCDTGPWNFIARDARPVALIDWEFAGPVDRLWELAQLVWLNAQLHDDDVAEMNGLPDAASRARQAGAILDGYGLAKGRRVGFVDRMIELAVLSARDDAVDHGVTPQTATAVGKSGYPYLWGITWRVRSAAWMITNRRLLESATA